MKTVLFFVLALGIAILVTLQYIIATGFAANTEKLRRKLVTSQQSGAVDIDAIPEIMRWFATRAGAKPGAPAIVRLTQAVTMKLAPDQSWQTLSADHIAGNYTSGFVWYASGTMMNVVPVGVVDAFVEGNGLLNARLFNSISVALADGPLADRGELMRYLAEIPWTPDAIFNNAALVWQQRDAKTVSVTAASNDGPAIVEFTFDGQGDIVEINAAARPMGMGPDAIDMPWRGTLSNYKQIGPRRVPAHAEVSWVLPEGAYVYFRGDVTSYSLE